jgi:hypothetical protein
MYGGDPYLPALGYKAASATATWADPTYRGIMALSDSELKKNRATVRRRSVVDGRRRHWSDSQKTEAVQTYMILGSLKLVAGALKIPFDTLKVWKQSEWWKQMEGDLRTQDDLQLSARLTKIVNRSYDVIEDRMEHGDFVYDQKSGKMKRKPVSMRDAHKVAIDLMDKKDTLVDRHMKGETITTDKIEKTLADLAANFAKIANQINTHGPVEVTDVIFGDDNRDAKETT